jgi:uncharacterized membrane protein
MDSSPIVLLILFCLFIVVGSILAFIAFAATRRIESTLESLPLSELVRRVYKLEQQLTELQKLASPAPPPAPSAVQTPPPVPPTVAPEPAQVLPPPPPVRPRELTRTPPHLLPRLSKEPSADDLEALIGGRWFNRIGIIALLFAVSYFLKLAFDNNWIGPAGRVTIGIILGVVMLPWSEWLLQRDYSYFSEGIAGLGEATLFVSVWAGCQYYTLFSRQTGFVALVLVTLVMAFLALRRDSPRIAFLSLLGGLLTPALMSSGKNEQIMLFSYLLCLGAAALAVSWRRNWQFLLPLSFVGTHLYFWQWYDMFYSRGLFLQRTLLFATFFFVLYSAIPILRAVRRSPLTSLDHLLVAANAAAYAGALFVMLWPDNRALLALIFLLLAVFHAVVALLFQESESLFSRFVYLSLAVAFFTLAIPVRFDGNTITLCFAIEGSALAWIGFRYHAGLLRPAGYFLILTAAFRLLVFPPRAGTFLWNDRFGSYLILVASIVAPLWVAVSSRSGERTAPYPPTPVTSPVSSSNSPASEIAFLSIAANFFALLALTFEFWDYLGRGHITREHSLAQNLSISILWTAYAAALIVFGLLRRSGLLRWQALVLLGVVVAKVFFLDLSSLDRAYRIASFFILGMVLLAVSFAYQRKQSRPAS